MNNIILEKLSKIGDLILGNEVSSILISVHDNMDADAIGSMYGLKYALDNAKDEVNINTVDMYIHEPIDNLFEFLVGKDTGKITMPRVHDKYDLIISLDTSTEERAPRGLRQYGKTLCTIDHHMDGHDWGDINFRYGAAATGVIVTKLLITMATGNSHGIVIPYTTIFPKCAAKALYTAITGDTGNFAYSNTDAESLKTAAFLASCGAEPFEISDAYSTRPLSHFRLLERCLSTIHILDDTIITAYVTEEMLQNTNATQADAASMVNYIRNIQGTEIAILFIEDGNSIRVRFRSKGREIRSLASTFGGGGHKMASGARIKGKLPKIINEVIGEAAFRYSS